MIRFGALALSLAACASQPRLPSADSPETTASDSPRGSAGLKDVVSTHGLYSLSYPTSWKVLPDPERTTLDVATPDTSAEVTVSGDFNVATNGPSLIRMVMLRVLPGAEPRGEWREEAHAGYRSLAGSVRAKGADWDWLFLFAADRVVQASVVYQRPASPEERADIATFMKSIKIHPQAPMPAQAGGKVVAETVP